MVVPPSPPLPLALVLRTGKNNGRARREKARSDDPAAQRPDRTALRAAGPRKAAVARSSSSCGGGEGEKQIDFEALKAPAC